MRSPYATLMPDMTTKIKGLETDIFYYGKGMQSKCIQSSKAYLEYVGRTYGQNEKQSIISNKIVITDTIKPMELATEADFKKLSFSDQKMWEKQGDAWFKRMGSVTQNLSKAYSILWTSCHSGLQQKIQSDKDYQAVKEGDLFVGELYRIIQKICHGNSSTDNPFTNLMEAYYNFLMVKGDAYESLALYFDAFEKKHEVLAKCGWSVTTPAFRDLYMKEMVTRDLTDTTVYRLLEAWQKEEHWVSSAKGEKAPRKAEREAVAALIEQFKAHVYIKRSGPRYDYYRTNLQNNYNEMIAVYPQSVVSAHHIMDHHKSVQANRPGDNTRESRGQVYEQQGFQKAHDPADVPGSEQDSGAPQGFRFKPGCNCFRCGREGHMTRECWFDTKEDGSPLNSAEEIDKMYQEKEQLRRRNRNRRGQSTSGTQHFISDDTATDAEIQHRDNNTTRLVLDVSKRNHVYNQETRCLRPYDVLFDSCSTCDIFVNEEFLRNIRHCKWTLTLKTQVGECRVTMIGDLPGVGTVWYYSQGSANILSAHRMVTRSGWSVNYSSDRYQRTNNPLDPCYQCTTKEGVEVLFAPTRQGLHVLDCKEMFDKDPNATVFGSSAIDNSFGTEECHSNTTQIDTIEASRNKFTKRDQAKAMLVRRFQHVAGHPSDATLDYAAATNSIRNSPITRRDIILAHEMLGRSEYAVQGKTTRTQPDAVVDRIVEVPSTIMEYYRDVELSVDVMHVNRVPFLVTLSKSIHYATVNALDNMKISTLEKTISTVFKIYAIRGFNVTTIHVDIQFKAMKDRKRISPAVNVVSKDEHVPEIERMIRVIKERARCYYAMLPYKRIPRMMIIQLMTTVIFYVNAFVWRQGVSQFLSPTTIVEGISLDFNKHFHVIFGEYVHTFEGTTNTMKDRTVGAIALGPSGNLQGGIRCYSLLTGKVLHRTYKDITQMKMPIDAIRRLQYRARKQKSVHGLEFADRHGNVDTDNSITGVIEPSNENGNENENENNASAESDEETENDNDFVAIDDEAIEPQEYDINVEEIDGNVEDITADEADEDMEAIEKELDTVAEGEQQQQDEEEEEEERQQDGDQDDELVAPENRSDEIPPPQSDNEEEDDEPTRTRSGRVSKPYDFADGYPTIYGDAHLTEACEKRSNLLTQSEHQLYIEALQYCDYTPNEIEALVYKTQTMSVRQGIKLHGKDGKESAMKEIKNLVENECFGETNYEKLTQEMKDKALPILMFMVMKRNGLLKTRGVADGSVQRLYTNKDDVSSPTPDFYAFKYICAVIAKEGRDVATVDLPGFFLQTEQEGDELILLKLTGEVALLLVECNEKKWKKHLHKEHGRDIIYVICKKAIYGTMNAALLAYKKLAKLFKQWRLTMNPYDPCVWNRNINGKQFTVVFHIDDLLMCHESPHVVSMIIKKLDDKYGSKDSLTVTRGPVHEYLGMTIDFRVKGECAYSQYDFLKKLILSLPESLKASYRNTPAPDYLFKVDADSPRLDKKRYEEYHTIVAKTLWASQRSRPDIQLANGFHCTRVKDANEHDWMKLGHLMGYIRKTRFIPLIIAMGDDGTVIYIDGAHAVHMDARGHSGLYLTLGKGAMINVSKKLSVATTSSTETEIVSTGERLPKCTWFRYFRLAQGEEATEDTLMQDNKSAITLQKRWPYSTRKGSKHIHVKYFFAVDKLKRKEIKLMHCPTEDMTADYNTKPLQGKSFIRFRDEIMGIREEDALLYKKRYAEVIKQYELYDETEADLFDI